MTALAQYQRLEAAGVWRPSPTERLRDVIVSFGEASLILRDLRSEQPLTHWSLPAVTRLNPGQRPAIFAPGGAAPDEVIEIDDPIMIEAIERIHTAIRAAHPRAGRLRNWTAAAVVLAALAAAGAWLPKAAIRHAAAIAAPAQRAEIGRLVLADLQHEAGPLCAGPGAAAVMDRLAARLLGAGGRIAVVPSTLPGAIALPGRIVVVGDNLVAGQSGPAVAAGHVLAADVAASSMDPLGAALRWAGPLAALRLVTTGATPPAALDGYGRTLIGQPPVRAEDGLLLARMQAAGVPAAPYARSLDSSGETVLPLIEADPFRKTAPPVPVLSQREWRQVQQICDVRG